MNKVLPHYKYEDRLMWKDSWELIEGLPYSIRPSSDPAHQLAGASIRTAFVIALRDSGCKNYQAYNPIDYKINEVTIVIPDILIVYGKLKKEYLDFAPALIVEILSLSTALKDRHTMYELYQQQKVKYYIIADPAKKTLEVFELKGKVYKPVTSASSYFFDLGDNCTIKPDLSNVFN
ncbi:MAG: Uma2 family endonuclease [Chitinophagaceae bacterium]|nr:Uma2 family endonuclease [Chitinophagaceae bacterium]